MTSLDKELFLNSLDSELRAVLKDLFDNGLYVCLVGGAVRDFFLTQKLGNDLDFEIRSNDKEILAKWDNISNLLKTIFKGKYNVEALNFEVVRVKSDKREYEFSSPRVEVYNKESRGHSNFKAEFKGDLSYCDSFIRRDFTVNAMGIEIKSLKAIQFIDPFNALNDLNERSLVPCSLDFYQDPVRFLRAIRFKERFTFDVSEKLIAQMKLMNLEELSLYYFFSEFNKSKKGNFFKEFFEYSSKFSLKLSREISQLSFLRDIDLKETLEFVPSKRDLILKAYAQKLLSSDQVMAVASFLFLKKAGLKSELEGIDYFYDLEKRKWNFDDLQGDFFSIIHKNEFLVFHRFYQFIKSHSDQDWFLFIFDKNHPLKLDEKVESYRREELLKQTEDSKELRQYISTYLFLIS